MGSRTESPTQVFHGSPSHLISCAAGPFPPRSTPASAARCIRQSPRWWRESAEGPSPPATEDLQPLLRASVADASAPVSSKETESGPTRAARPLSRDRPCAPPLG